ncbi:MAG: hypothetical protein ACK4JF_09030 [Methylohalobius sp.]
MAKLLVNHFNSQASKAQTFFSGAMGVDMGRFWVVLLWAAAGLGEAAGSWARFYGDNVQFSDLKLTLDGKAIVLGSLDDEDSCGSWVAKLDSGEIVWQKCYGGRFYAVLPTRDGGFLLVGQIEDPDEGQLLKLDAQGQVQWQKSYYVSLPEAKVKLRAALEMETGYIAVGSIEWDGPSKAWILGLDQNGNLLWQKTLTGFMATTIQSARDGNFLIAGAAEVAGQGEAWLLKLTPDGQSVWQKTYGGSEELPGGWEDVLSALDVQETLAGEYLLAGVTFDALPDLGGGFLPEFRARAWIAKLDQSGRLKWRRVYGEQLPFAQMTQVLPTPDGGFLAVGAGGDPKQGQGLAVWLAKLTAQGEIEWQKLYGKAGFNDALFLKQLADGKLLLAGASFLNTRGDWLLKLEADGSLPECGLEGLVTVFPGDASLRERAIARAESPPVVIVRQQEARAEDRSVVALPACPVAEAFGSCSQIQAAGKSYGDGSYPVALRTPTGPELLGARCAMKAFGGGWMLIARRLLNDPRPPSDFVNLRFGEYDGFSESFSIWPVVDWRATSGVVGLSWIEDFELKASLLGDLSAEKLQAILATSPQVAAWVR